MGVAGGGIGQGQQGGGAFASSTAPGASFGGAGRWGARPVGPLTAGHHFPSGCPRCAGASPGWPPAGIFSPSVEAIVCDGWGGDEGGRVPVAQLPLQFLIPLPSLSTGEAPQHPQVLPGLAERRGARRLAQPFCKGSKTPYEELGHAHPFGF